MLLPEAASADFVSDNNCPTAATNPAPATWAQSKGNYYLFNYSALNEGYHWGGGCWNDNNVDDSPGEVPQTAYPRGEGPDCSGFVFKAWGLRTDASSNAGFSTRSAINAYHGPYTANSYRSENTSWKNVEKADAGFWDAFASRTHIGLVYQHNSDGSDLIFEAKQESVGTGIFQRTYRATGSYVAAARKNWAA